MTRTFQQTPIVRGRGLISNVIENLPFEAHIPGYNFCGPSTKLQKRLQRGDVGINPLDEFCKQHDIFYSQQKDLTARQQADKLLADQAIQRAFASDSSFGERMAALGVAGAMKAKKKDGFWPAKTSYTTKKETFEQDGKGFAKKITKIAKFQATFADSASTENRWLSTFTSTYTRGSWSSWRWCCLHCKSCQ
ncbi:unnamed protein product [Acanthoscelides obtectus]|uniref:Phospholipase A2-like domain-containing protein n=1 Tax=Acanthoscelides obtectus TaxID=200917 RepID=A0A9P0Q4F9_ACAOB|nr:unnamed protein product [Acanthoscelides obtectus]CAK1663643.1 hypothetical protein AOBTE_LOCUS23766 [Acanthoscelides obtectus]